MTRREVKDLAESKLRGRWTNFVLLTLIVSIIQIAVTAILVNMNEGVLHSILNLCDSFLLAPFLGAILIVYVVKLVNSDEILPLKEGIPSRRIWINFIKKLLVLILFTLPAIILSGIAIAVAFMNVYTNFYGSLFSNYMNYTVNYMNYTLIVERFLGVLIIVLILVAIYNIIISLLLFPVKYIIVDKPEVGIWEAVGKGFKIMKGHKWQLFILQLSLIGWGILAILPIIIGIVLVALMAWNMLLIAPFGIGLLWFSCYANTVYRVYYLSIVEKKVDPDEKLGLDKESDLEEKLDKEKDVNLEKEANSEKDQSNISIVEVDEDDFEI